MDDPTVTVWVPSGNAFIRSACGGEERHDVDRANVASKAAVNFASGP
ncbi:hypothetical protein [Yinghuangia soli]|uniref:Uncharacterized protein n=1 Tax=Yinghuangia soli TaxID=2908204 RepID=A0AA41Q6A6_9ACTN|nr:hypothetical protein [Yinghuangia soli]MCF2531471.1 hypothetical protein [Yinghuangia soli]